VPVFDEPSMPEDQPDPTVELALFRVFIEAYVSLLPRDEALTYLRRCAQIITARDDMANIVPIRKSERSKMEAAQLINRKTVAAFRRVLEGCIARVQAYPDASNEGEGE
jgi:hypothetical protein